MTWLPRESVERLTGKKRYSAQRRVLKGMGIPFDDAATGEPLVPLHYSTPQGKTVRRPQPRWENL